MTDRAWRQAPAPDRPNGPAGFTAFLLMTAAMIAVVMAGLIHGLGGVLLAPARWLDALEASGAYERAPVAIAEQVIAWVDSRPPEQPRTLAPLDRTDVEAIVITLVPPDWLRGQAQIVVPAIVDGAASTGPIRAVVSLEAMKARFTSGPLLTTVLDRIGTWPACTDEQLRTLLKGVLSRCQPPQASRNLLAVAVAGLLVVVAAELPASVDLATPGPIPGSGALASAGLTDALRLAASARSMLPLLVAAAIVLLLLASFVAARSTRRLLVIWAAPLLVAGLVLLAVGLVVDPVLAAGVGTLRTGLAAGGLAPGLVGIVGASASAMVDHAGWLLVEVGAPLVVAALVMLTLAAFAAGGRRA